MLSVFRLRTKSWSAGRTRLDRGFKKCKCPIHVEGKCGDSFIRKSLGTTGYLSHEQMLRFMRLGADSFLRHSLNWRLRRLVEHGLLVRDSTPILARTRVYSVGALGVELAGQGEFCAVPIHGSGNKPLCTSVPSAWQAQRVLAKRTGWEFSSG